ncbi:hypothetical protein [Dictyobacter arantiisoli]|uniref:Uncharacterized protein n=1 Tax=Dictyobacter arantiisoli TaxID=2014874 RepID=A0A5A5TIL8_9CHLR|nr:hypothetical protein [Dictyobacter arantiisoli]GCF11172.1 hypothetical protein KDI_47360 [Dictyobacter arantiisoli]
MYSFNLETLLYFARIRHLRGTFQSNAFYGFGAFHDPCVVIITVYSGSILSCNIYNRHSQMMENAEPALDVLRHTVAEWTFNHTTGGQNNTTGGPIPSFAPPSAPSSPNINLSSSEHLSSSVKPQPQGNLPPLNIMGNSRPSGSFQSDAFSALPAARNPTGPVMFTTEPYQNSSSKLDLFPNLVPHRLKAVSGAEVLQWKGNIKSIYMRTNGINTIAQIATMLSLEMLDVLQILLQLEKDGLISLDKPV